MLINRYEINRKLELKNDNFKLKSKLTKLEKIFLNLSSPNFVLENDGTTNSLALIIRFLF